MADLQHPAALTGQVDQLLGLLGGFRDRLFHQYVGFVAQETGRDLGVTLGRSGNADRIDLAKKLAVIAPGARAEFRGYFPGHFEIGVSHPDKLAIRQCRILLGMESPQVTHPDHRRSDFLHAAAIMPKHRTSRTGSFLQGVPVIDVSNRLRRMALYYRGARGLWRELLAACLLYTSDAADDLLC